MQAKVIKAGKDSTGAITDSDKDIAALLLLSEKTTFTKLDIWNKKSLNFYLNVDKKTQGLF